MKIYEKAEAHTSMNNGLLKTWWDSAQLPGTWLIVLPIKITHQVHLSCSLERFNDENYYHVYHTNWSPIKMNMDV
jgi:hypothetical protein